LTAPSGDTGPSGITASDCLGLLTGGPVNDSEVAEIAGLLSFQAAQMSELKDVVFPFAVSTVVTARSYEDWLIDAAGQARGAEGDLASGGKG
jgi:hypothetical protein